MNPQARPRRAHPNLTPDKLTTNGFTLIEVLVVIAIITIMASMFLPALSGAKERAKMARCLSNQNQIGVAFQMYRDDNQSKFPTIRLNRDFKSFEVGGGDPDPRVAAGVLAATNRPLWPYTKSRELFRCPADRGLDIFQPYTLPSMYDVCGTSYKYNDVPWVQTRRSQDDPVLGLAGKPESWIPSPSRYIVLHDQPALPNSQETPPIINYSHYARAPFTVRSFSQMSQRSIAVALLADGHVLRRDFTSFIKADTTYYAEPTAEWDWYKPK